MVGWRTSVPSAVHRVDVVIAGGIAPERDPLPARGPDGAEVVVRVVRERGLALPVPLHREDLAVAAALAVEGDPAVLAGKAAWAGTASRTRADPVRLETAMGADMQVARGQSFLSGAATLTRRRGCDQGHAPASLELGDPMTVQPNEHDRFVLRQRIRPVVNQYEFSLPGPDGLPGEPVCFVEQKRFKFKEDIRFFTDDRRARSSCGSRRASASTRAPATTSRRRRREDRRDPEGVRREPAALDLHALRRGRRRGREGARAQPAGGALPAARRPRPVHRRTSPTGCRSRTTSTSCAAAPCSARTSAQRWKFRDTYTIDMSGDPEHTVDRRMILAIAVGMDALQAR